MLCRPINRLIFWLVMISGQFFTGPGLISAQSIRYEIENVPSSKELSGFSGLCILQDSDGFMWFGASHGLYRYDGARFLSFLYDPQNEEEGLRHEMVTNMLEDEDGIIWFTSLRAVTRFDRKTEQFKHFVSDYPAPVVFLCMIEGNDGFLWFGTINGLCKFDKKTGTYTNYNIDSSSNSKQIYTWICSIKEDGRGNLWLRNDPGELFVFNRNTEIFSQVDNAPPDINQIFEDSSGRIWLTSDDGIYRIDSTSGKFQRYFHGLNDEDSLTDQHTMNFLEDEFGQFWINTYDGIYLYNQDFRLLDKWKYPEPASFYPDLFFYEKPRSLYMDKSGTVWGFSGNGIYKIIRQFENFNTFVPDPRSNKKSDIASSNIVNPVLIMDENGICELNPANRTYRKQSIDSGGGLARETFMRIDDREHRTTYLYVDEFGVIWLGTNKRGLFRGIRNKAGEIEFSSFLSDTSKTGNYPGLYIYRIFEDSKGRIWIGTNGHLPSYYDREKGCIVRLVNNPGSDFRLAEGISVQVETEINTLLVAEGDRGIYEIIPPLIHVSENTVMPSNVLNIGSNYEAELVQSKILFKAGDKNTLWVLRGRMGMNKLTLSTESGTNTSIEAQKYYTVEDGLPSNRILSIMEDKQGNLWLGTKGGISRFNPETEVFSNFQVHEDIANKRITHEASSSADGGMYFRSTHGILSFYPDSIQYNRDIPPIMITGLRINHEPLSPMEDTDLDSLVSYTHQLVLPFNRNNISLEYAALNFIRPFLNQYKYKLEGFNDDWIFVGNRSRVDFTNLNPGKYTFRVIGSNNDGIWNEEGASLRIIIISPPWSTWWAFVIYGIIISVIILINWNYFHNRARMRTELAVERIEKEKVRELDQMKSRFFANISHEFRTPLTLILGPAEDLAMKPEGRLSERDRGLLRTMKRNAMRLKNLINQLLDISKLETGEVKLSVSEGDIEEFVRTIILSFLSLAESKQIQYHHELPGASRLAFFDSDKLEKILINLISNAFKFTPAEGSIRICLGYIYFADSKRVQEIEITVEDSGKGIPSEQQERVFDRFYQVGDSDTRDQEGTGIGLALTREMVDLYRGKISLDSEEGRGSTFRVTLPVAKELFSEEEIAAAAPVRDETGTFASEIQKIESESGTTDPERKNLPRNKAPIVLVIEDNADLRNYISGTLEANYNVVTAEDGKAGMKMAYDIIPDLIISDVMMPEMDGITLGGILKKDERTDHIPFVILTAKADRESKFDGLETGADDYIIKPFDAEELQIRVKNLIDQRKKLVQKIRKTILAESNVETGQPVDPFLEKVMRILNDHLSEPEFTMEDLGKELFMSRAQLFRKIPAVAGISPNELFRLTRMKQAATLIRSGDENITQIMYQVGMRNPSHFAQSFRKYFGVNPSKYKQTLSEI